MNIEELMKDIELQKEMKTLVEGGMEPVDAKIRVLKDHGVTFDEDALKAQAVGRMKLDDETISEVAGGSFWTSNKDSCFVDHSCLSALCHDENGTDQDCWSSYFCLYVYIQRSCSNATHLIYED